VHPVDVVKHFLDPKRLAVAGSLADGRTATVDELVVHTGLSRRDVLEALGGLTGAGIAVAVDGSYRLDLTALRETARSLATEELPMDPVIGFGMSDDERLVLSRFFHGRTLHEIPSNRAKRLVVLERLALEFDVGRRYPEREVNQILGAFHPDWSALRRFLVDEGFLARDHGVYWRTGGKFVDLPPGDVEA
jgi:hypothetical protein